MERSKGVLAEEQAGFRKNRSTTDQIFIMHEVIKGRKPEKTFACFNDNNKSYDRLLTEGLRKKLKQYGLRGRMWRVLKKMYEKVESCVMINGKSTSFFEIKVGVRQGCTLSPIIFIFFINGLIEEINQTGKGEIWVNKDFDSAVCRRYCALSGEQRGS